MNKVFLIGRLAGEPIARSTPNGVAVTTFRLIVNRSYDKDKSDGFSVVAWRGLAEICAKYLVKGQQVAVTGELQTRSYEDKQLITKHVTEIMASDVEFLAKPKGAARAYPQSRAQDEAPFAEETGMLEDEEWPF